MGELCDQFELLVDKANQRGRPDSPARYFHIKTINRLRAIGLELVAGSKTLHHLLPDLVPPIDRRYTLDFFFGRKTIRNPQADFSEVFVNYLYIYERTSELVDRMIAKNPLNSSVTKVIDNAIIGYQAESRTLT